MLRGEPVVDRDDDTVAGGRQRPAGLVVRFEIAEDPATAVVKDDHRVRTIALRTVDADRDPAQRSGNLELLDAPDLVEPVVVGHEEVAEELSGPVDREVGDVGDPHRGEFVEQFLDVRVWFCCHSRSYL
jgi:hypothetical protein